MHCSQIYFVGSAKRSVRGSFASEARVACRAIGQRTPDSGVWGRTPAPGRGLGGRSRPDFFENLGYFDGRRSNLSNEITYLTTRRKESLGPRSVIFLKNNANLGTGNNIENAFPRKTSNSQKFKLWSFLLSNHQKPTLEKKL